LDVRERQRAIGVGYAGHLVERGDRVAHMRRVGQRLFPLLRKGEDRLIGVDRTSPGLSKAPWEWLWRYAD
jgi:hypothetical protein